MDTLTRSLRTTPPPASPSPAPAPAPAAAAGAAPAAATVQPPGQAAPLRPPQGADSMAWELAGTH
eukprot:2599055-Pyramimonas_sp.AAC.1